MACAMKNCHLGDNEIYIRCWICEKEYHSKCAGLSARVADALRENKGVRWSCESCRDVQTDFFQLFKQCRSAFVEISKDLAGVQSKLSKYEDAFKMFSVFNANTLDNSPPKKRKNLRSNNKINTAEKISLTPVPPSITASNEVMVVDEIQPIMNSDLNLVTVAAPILSTSTSKHKDLVIVPPKKGIFLSRFANSTTENDVLFYISSKIKHVNDINISKFTFSKPRAIASFKMFVPLEYYKDIVDPSFWPKNTVVHEYVLKTRPPNNVVTLPKN